MRGSLGSKHPFLLAVARAREAVLACLADAFARDELGIDEYERRVSVALEATKRMDFARLTADLSEYPGAAIEQLRNPFEAPPAQIAQRPRPRLGISGLLWLGLSAWMLYSFVDFIAFMFAR